MYITLERNSFGRRLISFLVSGNYMVILAPLQHQMDVDGLVLRYIDVLDVGILDVLYEEEGRLACNYRARKRV